MLHSMVLHNCSLCEYSSSKESALFKHLSRKHKINRAIVKRFDPHQCKLCEFSTRSIRSFEMHKSREHNEKFICNDCGYKVNTRENLKLHYERVHCHQKIIDLKLFHCAACEISYKSKLSLKQHDKTVHLQIRFKCSRCNYEATQKSHLNSHNRTVHLKEKHACDICGKEYTQKSHVSTHKKMSHMKEKPFQCKLCDYKASLKCHLKVHIESIHEGVTYPCKLCSYAATQKQVLKSHLITKHSQGSLKCKYCSESFVTNPREGLNRHLLNVHNIKPESRDRI